MDKITAQVAAEAVANDPDAYSSDTIEHVRAAATKAGVSRLYLDLLPAPVGHVSDVVMIQGAEFQL